MKKQKVVKRKLRPMEKVLFCKMNSLDKKRDIIIDQIMMMSVNDIDQMIIQSRKFLGKFIAKYLPLDKKQDMLIKSIRKLDQKGVDEIIMKS